MAIPNIIRFVFAFQRTKKLSFSLKSTKWGYIATEAVTPTHVCLLAATLAKIKGSATPVKKEIKQNPQNPKHREQKQTPLQIKNTQKT